MKRILLLLLSVLIHFSVSAQEYTDKMKSLIDYAVELRSSDSDSSVYRKLLEDNSWTLMDEIESAEGECSRQTRLKMKRFGINDLAYKVESQNFGQYISTGNFCNGADPRYNYSFIEKTITASATVSYDIKGRTGHQTFVLIPFIQDCKILASLIVKGEEFVGTRDKNGNVVIEADAGDDSSAPIKLLVTNSSDSDMSYIIINHNSRTNK